VSVNLKNNMKDPQTRFFHW